MEVLEKLAECVEIGKADEKTSFLPALIGQKGASELTREALELGLRPGEILSDGLITGMNRIGEKFASGKVYIPNLLISAKAMKAAMEHLVPYFERGDAKYKGTFVIGTVQGDMHDIGKNIVKMVLQGGGWNIIDLGTNTSLDKFLEAIEKNEAKMVGLSALLTTTMLNMGKITEEIKKKFSEVKVFVGGAPLSSEYNDRIGADGYFKDPHGLAKHIEMLVKE